MTNLPTNKLNDFMQHIEKTDVNNILASLHYAFQNDAINELSEILKSVEQTHPSLYQEAITHIADSNESALYNLFEYGVSNSIVSKILAALFMAINTDSLKTFIGEVHPIIEASMLDSAVVDVTEETPAVVDVTEETPAVVDVTEETPAVVDVTEETPAVVDVTEETPANIPGTIDIPLNEL